MVLSKIALPIVHLPLFVLVAAASLPLYLLAAAAILALGRWPKWIFAFLEGALRWFMRISAFQYLLSDAYPPLVGRRDDFHPVRFFIPRPSRTARWRPFFAWVLVLPQLAALSVVYASIFLMVALAMISILFAKQIPFSIFKFLVQALTFHGRVVVYAAAMTDCYPGFSLDEGLPSGD